MQFIVNDETTIQWKDMSAALGWILDARNRRAHIYRPDGVEIPAASPKKGQ